MKYSIYIIWRNWQIVLSLQPVPHTRLCWRETTLPLIWKQISSPCNLLVRTIGIIILSTTVGSYKAPTVYPVLLQALFVYFFSTMRAAQLLSPFYRRGNWALEAAVASWESRQSASLWRDHVTLPLVILADSWRIFIYIRLLLHSGGLGGRGQTGGNCGNCNSRNNKK